MEHWIHRTTPPHTLPIFYLWFFLHNKLCSMDFCVVFSTAVSIYTNFPTPKQPPGRMLNQLRTSHIAKIRLTTQRISKTRHLKGVNTLKHNTILRIRNGVLWDWQYSTKCSLLFSHSVWTWKVSKNLLWRIVSPMVRRYNTEICYADAQFLIYYAI